MADKKYIDLEGMTTLYNDLRARLVQGGGEHSHAMNGYEVLPSGLMIQWGLLKTMDTQNETFEIKFTKPFPNVFLSAFFTPRRKAGSGPRDKAAIFLEPRTDEKSKTEMYISWDFGTTAPNSIFWVALGY